MYFFHTLEVETTNYCNANCVFCANNNIQRERGYISVASFKQYMREMGKILHRNYFYHMKAQGYPRINFCGLGDPLLHQDLGQLIRCAKTEGYYTQVVTNGICLSSNKALELCECGIDKICLSIHSVNPDHYKSITGIELSSFLMDAIEAIKICVQKGVDVNIWRILHPLEENRDTLEDEKKYEDFLSNNGLSDILILGPSEPWYRDGVVPNSKCEIVDDFPLWCNKIVFSDYIDWQGNSVLCCNDFNRETIRLGNVFEQQFSYDALMKKKIELLLHDNKPLICRNCRRWKDTEVLSIIASNNIEISDFRNTVSDYLNEIGGYL